MVSAHGKNAGLTSWGQRNGKQVWRVWWKERPDMYADVTGPWETMDALIKLKPEVLARLPWQHRG